MASHDVGFVLLTHANPGQALRLILQLNTMFGRPPIVCHHDFSQCDINPGIFPDNVAFVRPHVRTAWAEFSAVEATVRAIKQMYEMPTAPEWFIVLSGADYPIKPAQRVVSDLQSGGYDAHIHYELIQAGSFQRDWHRLCYERYCTKLLFTYPSLTKRLRPAKRELRLSLSRHPRLAARYLPFAEHFRCFAGSQWFAGNHRVADYVVRYHAANTRLKVHYRSLLFSEESYFQSILGNASHLKLHNENYRYVDWSAGGPHPTTLTLNDLPRLIASKDHFARKFSTESSGAVLDALDAVTSPR